MRLSPALSQYFDRVDHGKNIPFEKYLGKKVIRESKHRLDTRNSYRKTLDDDLGGYIVGMRYCMDALKILFASQYTSDHEKNSENAYKWKQYKHTLSFYMRKNDVKRSRTLSGFIFLNFIAGKESKTNSPLLSMYRDIFLMERELLPLYYFDHPVLTHEKKIDKPIKKPLKKEGFKLYDRTKRKQLTFDL